MIVMPHPCLNNDVMLRARMNDQQAYLQCLICKYASLDLYPVSPSSFSPRLAHSICHLARLTTPTTHSAALFCFLHSLASFATFFGFNVVTESIFFILFSISYVVFSIHLCSASVLSSLYPSTLPSELHSDCLLPSYQQCKSSTGDTALPVVSRLNDIFGLALSDCSRQEMKTNLSPRLTPHLLLLFVFYNTNMLSAVTANISELEYIDRGRRYKINNTR